MADVFRNTPGTSHALRARVLFVAAWLVPAAASAGDIDFVRDVAPIFEKHCLLCHRGGRTEGDLDLSTAAGLKDAGFVTPERPGESHLLEVVSADAGERPRMPKSGRPLSKAQVEILRQWIREGSRWPAGVRLPMLWSLKAVAKLQKDDSRSLDSFVRAHLAERGFKPAPPASRRVLIRRLKMDLLGLPPTPAEIDAFMNDPRPDAWARLIDQFLKSPHYGERWAQHWLDVVRFSESNGYEEDSMRPHAWPYRDYVIRSLNADKPYDQFIREQLAGDALKPLTKDGMIATTMLVNGPYDHAAAVSQSLVERTRAREVMLEEMLTTVCQSILGLTVNCARCHDHKFDPIPQRDYYRIKSVFDGVHQNVGRLYEPQRILLPDEEEAWKRDQATVRQLESDLASLREGKANLGDTQNFQPLNRAVALWQFDGAASAVKDSDRKGGQSGIDAKGTARFGVAVAKKIAAANSDQKILDAGRSTIVRNQPDGAGYAIRPDIDGSELVPRGAMSIFARVRFTGRFNGTEDVIRIGDRGKPTRDTCGFEFVQSDSDGQHARVRFVVTGQGREKESGVTLATVVNLDTWYDLCGVFEPAGKDRGRVSLTVSRPGEDQPIALPVATEVDFASLSTAAYQNLLIFVAPSFLNGPQPGAQMDLAAVWHEALGDRERRWLSVADADAIPAPGVDEKVAQKLETQITKLEAELLVANEKLASVQKAMIGYRLQPEPTVLFERGDVRSPGPVMTPAGLSAVSTLPSEFELASNSKEADRRRQFAAWVTDRRNPLTARVIVNRVWHHHFGRGIVDTPSDFGVNGGRPSHPELLDWLTAKFIDEGWSLKKLHRRILSSETWRQSSRLNARASQLDSENRLLWRFTPRRMDAESVRDAMLFISGELNPKMGGPSFQPFTTTRFNTTFYHLADKGEPEFNRRTIYRMHINTGRDPLLDALDCPAPSVLAPERRETVTPLQALGLMNDSFVLRQSDNLAARVSGAGSTRESQIQEAWERVLGRPPRPDELASALAVVRESDLKTLCWVLINSSEFLQIR